MNINITTQTTNGNIILYLLDSKLNKLLTLRNNDQGSCNLVPGKTYRLEWHVWGSVTADYTVQALAVPPSANFLPFNWAHNYNGPHQDMGGFYITA